MNNTLKPIEDVLLKELEKNPMLKLFPSIKGITPEFGDFKGKKELEENYIARIALVIESQFNFKSSRDDLLKASDNMRIRKVDVSLKDPTIELFDLQTNLRVNKTIDFKAAAIKAQEEIVESYFKFTLRSAIIKNDEKQINRLSAIYAIMQEENPSMAKVARKAITDVSKMGRSMSSEDAIVQASLKVANSSLSNLTKEVFDHVNYIDPQLGQSLINKKIYIQRDEKNIWALQGGKW